MHRLDPKGWSQVDSVSVFSKDQGDYALSVYLVLLTELEDLDSAVIDCLPDSLNAECWLVVPINQRRGGPLGHTEAEGVVC